MVILKIKNDSFDQKASIIKEALDYFSNKEDTYPEETREAIAAAADNAFCDEILFEEFQTWTEDRDDESFLHLINHYWNTKDQEPLPEEQRDITSREEDIKAIKEKDKLEVAGNFSILLNKMATEKGLKSLEEIGNFLGFSAERARTLLDGKHKPQRKTILKVADKFGVSADSIFQEII